MEKILIEKLVGGGQGLGHLNGKAVFVWNALPGEEVEFEYLRNKKDYAEGVAVNILTPSKHRQAPQEAHFLSSSPWQIMDFAFENEWKRKIAAEQYSKIGDMILSGDDMQIEKGASEIGYRNKIEFSFCKDENEQISLAFFERGKKVLTPVQAEILAEPVINEVAQSILLWIQKEEIPLRSLKSLILRSNGAGQAIAALFIKDKLTFADFPKLSDKLLGFHLYYSTHKSPASVPTALLHSEGQDYLIATILGTKLKFGLLSFFQINIPVFTKALQDIAAFLDPHMPVVDFYSGVGAISLPLSQSRTQTELVESNEEAIAYAEENVKANSLPNCSTVCAPAEKMTDFIDPGKMVILDPPRIGLHDKVVSVLLQKKPKRILYLSCDIATQARDLRLLSQGYKIIFMKLYNFFPRTPHTEGLVVLERM